MGKDWNFEEIGLNRRIRLLCVCDPEGNTERKNKGVSLVSFFKLEISGVLLQRQKADLYKYDGREPLHRRIAMMEKRPEAC